MDENRKTPMITKILYGCGAGGGNVMSTILASFLLSYYTDTALMGAAAVSTMFLISRVLDGITDIIMGVLWIRPIPDGEKQGHGCFSQVLLWQLA